MNDYLNGTCAICGSKYHMCASCAEETAFKPWRTIVDSPEHYKIYLVLRDYTNKFITKEEAKESFNNCDLTGMENFYPEVKAKIDEIMFVPKNITKKNNSKSYKK